VREVLLINQQTEEIVMPKYNGHKNWNHWNVSLWINNDEGLYREAQAKAKRLGKDMGARMMRDSLLREGITHTPDGAPYSVSAIRAAMSGMEG
jgi:hypothetical protein